MHKRESSAKKGLLIFPQRKFFVLIYVEKWWDFFTIFLFDLTQVSKLFRNYLTEVKKYWSGKVEGRKIPSERINMELFQLFFHLSRPLNFLLAKKAHVKSVSLNSDIHLNEWFLRAQSKYLQSLFQFPSITNNELIFIFLMALLFTQFFSNIFILEL